MKLGFAYRRYHLPFRAPVRTAHGAWTAREGLVVQLKDNSGHAGYGEAAPIPWFGSESVDQAELAARGMGDQVEIEAGSPGTRLAVGSACLCNAVASAWAELRATATPPGTQQPLVRSGADYRSVAALLPAGPAVLAQIAAKADAGFRVFKWKVGVADAADEIALLDDVCAALPEGSKLRLDANGAWDLRVAERWLARCADRPIEFVEQPCFAAASESAARQRQTEERLRGLARDYPTPIALDESLVGNGDVTRWIGTGWRGVYVVKPALLADPRGAVEELATAKADVVFSSALETGIGARAALGLAFGWTGEHRALGFGVWPLFARPHFDGPAATPFLRWQDVERINCQSIWEALASP